MKLKSIIASTMAVLICISSVATTAMAAAPVHENAQSVYEGDGYHVEYSVSGGNVVEYSQFTFSDSSAMTMTRVVRPNNAMTITTVLNTGERTTTTGTGDYDLFYSLYEDQKNTSSGLIPFGSEVIGAQYYHRYIGRSGPERFYVDDLERCQNVAQVAEVIAALFDNKPAMLITATAEYIFNVMLQNLSFGCEIIQVTSETYEVLFSFDHRYYTHCYHQVVEECTGSGSVLKRSTDYFQSIGG